MPEILCSSNSPIKKSLANRVTWMGCPRHFTINVIIFKNVSMVNTQGTANQRSMFLANGAGS
jgi:hypothetical protein